MKCFRKNLRKGGLLYLDMRNAAIFLTDKGQQRLREEGVDETVYQGQKATVRIRLSIDLEKQLLNRDYYWNRTDSRAVAASPFLSAGVSSFPVYMRIPCTSNF